LPGERFRAKAGPVAECTERSLADYPHDVTLDQLQPYDLNPRVTRNRVTTTSSIRLQERGPTRARRAIHPHGPADRTLHHSRMAATRDFAICASCGGHEASASSASPAVPALPKRGEIIALPATCRDMELARRLFVIHRARPGVEEEARGTHEQDPARRCPQSEAGRVAFRVPNGYPVAHHTSAHAKTPVRYLLPADPRRGVGPLLYGRLGTAPGERLTALRRRALGILARRAARTNGLAVRISVAVQRRARPVRPATPTAFLDQRCAGDELIGRMAEFAARPDYDSLTLEIGRDGPAAGVPDSDPVAPHRQSGNCHGTRW